MVGVDGRKKWYRSLKATLNGESAIVLMDKLELTRPYFKQRLRKVRLSIERQNLCYSHTVTLLIQVFIMYFLQMKVTNG